MDKLQQRLYFVSPVLSGSAILLVGNKKTCLIDSGMAFAHTQLIKNIKEILGDRPLDFLAMSHSHYDHMGALPYLRGEWPNLVVAGSAACAGIFLKDSARKLMRKLGLVAAQNFKGEDQTLIYDPDHIRVDLTLYEGDSLELGGCSLKMIATPGHTRCSVSYYIPQWDLLLASETTGVPLTQDSVAAVFLVSCKQALEAVDKMQAVGASKLVLPHNPRVYSGKEVSAFFENSKKAMLDTRDFILKGHEENKEHQQIFSEYEQVFRTEAYKAQQPYEAFVINTNVQIERVIKEYCE